MLMFIKELLSLKIEDEDYMMIEKLPMIYRCVTLMMLMMSSPTIFVVVVEYPSR